ncbi:MAG: adenylate cyclase, partial [Oscillospiraceae bacterium]|nr:adenylate cyclase [Oscillospiraceae bacterium]
TTGAPAVATGGCMIFTWLKYGKPDVSMCLNAALAGLVGITAGCDVMDCFGAIMVGIVSGLLVVFGVWLLDYKLHVDDPVGAVAVHCFNGIWGGVAVGLFATTSAPGNDSVVGLFYGGGLSCLGIQCLGVIAIAAWTAATISLFFLLLKKTMGLRVSPEDEITGLDISEHGLVSAYADFMPALGAGVASIGTVTAEPAAPAPASAPAATASAPVSVDDAVPVQVRSPKPVASDSDVKLTNVTILLHQEKFEDLKAAMMDIGITGMTVTNVMGCGVQKGKPEYYRGVAQDITLLPRMQVEIVVSKVPVQTVVDTAKKVLYTGHIGDGKIFIYNVENVIKVRTGEEGYAALQDVEQF